MSRCPEFDPNVDQRLSDSPSARCVRGSGHRGMHRDPFGDEFTTDRENGSES